MNQTIQQINFGHIYRDNNTANTLERFAREVTPMQHFRELFINAKESGASKKKAAQVMSKLVMKHQHIKISESSA
jgi:spore coat polysaccharide biosynthesis predicted glycosyltransferase SpsG